MAKVTKIYISVDKWPLAELEGKLKEEGYKWGSCAWETPELYQEEFEEPQPYYTEEGRVLLVYDNMTMMMGMVDKETLDYIRFVSGVEREEEED